MSHTHQGWFVTQEKQPWFHKRPQKKDSVVYNVLLGVPFNSCWWFKAPAEQGWSLTICLYRNVFERHWLNICRYLGNLFKVVGGDSIIHEPSHTKAGLLAQHLEWLRSNLSSLAIHELIRSPSEAAQYRSHYNNPEVTIAWVTQADTLWSRNGCRWCISQSCYLGTQELCRIQKHTQAVDFNFQGQQTHLVYGLWKQNQPTPLGWAGPF